MKNTFLIAFFLLSFSGLNSQNKVYEIDINVPPVKIKSDHLKLGGSNPAGDHISVNNYFLSINNKPFIPVTGEFHYPRYPNAYWDESIKKMKAGGINVVATYVFWNIHEENQGQFLWEGDRNLRRFVELCAENGVYAIIRIGPFCHGEIRNGGLPDWLLGKPLTIRSNDPVYLQAVEKLYSEIGKQIKGLYYKDGGPIIGIQIENEYQHSASPWGLMYPGQPYDWTAAEQDLAVTQAGVGVAEGNNPYAGMGNDHMKILKTLAEKAGMITPLYTATGWGYAAIIPNESIPVTSAYAYPFWTEKKDLSPLFLYKNMHADPDYSPVRYVPEDYPAFAAELGSGIMTVYTRRPIVDHHSMDALINRCLGSGANGLGYYMYHGGSTSRGDQYFYSDEAYGLPKVSYDFQAPIGEFGQVRDGFHRLKLIHFFTGEFGHLLAPMTGILPKNTAALTPDNLTELRYAVRAKGDSGFLFINNFQDDAVMADQSNIQIKIKSKTGDLLIPEKGGFNLKSGENAISPFRFDLNGALLNYATAQLMTKVGGANDPCYVFFAPEGVTPEFVFAKAKNIKISNNSGCTIVSQKNSWVVTSGEKGVSEFTVSVGKTQAKVLVMDKTLALQSWQVRMDGRTYLFFSEATVLQNGKTFTLHSADHITDVRVYPKINKLPEVSKDAVLNAADNPLMSVYQIRLPKVVWQMNTRVVGQRKHVVTLPPNLPAHVHDAYLTIDYLGDTAMGFIDGELVADEFYKGSPWQIGLRKFYPAAAGKEMVFYFRPIYKGATYLPDLNREDVPDFSKSDQLFEVRKISLSPGYQCEIKFN
ncbi:MAG: beta-galactosidase [Saprospiraceae bacterium]|nr:beta-galactosidase [Saprospiraceae bacterium]